jgi:hypothetical protein
MFNDEPDAGVAGRQAAQDWGPAAREAEPHPDDLVIICDLCREPLPCKCVRPLVRLGAEGWEEFPPGTVTRPTAHSLRAVPPTHGELTQTVQALRDALSAEMDRCAGLTRESCRQRLRIEALTDRLNRAAVALGRMEAWCRKGLKNGQELPMLAAVLGEIGPTLAEIRGV